MTSTDLAKIRAEQNKLLPDTVYIQRVVRTSDGAGGWSEAWQTAVITQGRMVPGQRAGETVQGGMIAAYGEYVVTLPHDTGLQQDDRLQISGTQYEVKAILDRSEKTALRVLVSKV